MREARTLSELLEEWRQASEAEGEAIEQGRWDEVARRQQSKSRLREIITASGEGTPVKFSQEPIQRALRQLVELELRNSGRLGQRRERLAADNSRLRCASGNLRRVRSAYGAGHPAAIWNSFS